MQAPPYRPVAPTYMQAGLLLKHFILVGVIRGSSMQAGGGMHAQCMVNVTPG